jgi:hypothetical protein
MNQLPQAWWNEVAPKMKTEPFKTLAALPADKVDSAIDKEWRRLARRTKDETVATAYLVVAPLLFDRKAIRTHSGMSQTTPEILTVDEALRTAQTEYRLTVKQIDLLRTLLESRKPQEQRATS